MRKVLAGVILLTAAAACPAAERKCSRWWDALCPWRLPLSLCCPDDYCGKPAPCLPPAYCPRGCDDYCPKPAPCLPAMYCPKGCDDYCAKPAPHLPCDLPYMKCHPSDGKCDAPKAARPKCDGLPWPWGLVPR